MIYLDSSGALAEILSETARPAPPFWSNRLLSSRLLEYEVWTSLYRLQASGAERRTAAALLATVTLIEMSETVLGAALRPQPLPLRTLDALHLATAIYLRDQEPHGLTLATYDLRLAKAVGSAGIQLADLEGSAP